MAQGLVIKVEFAHKLANSIKIPPTSPLGPLKTRKLQLIYTITRKCKLLSHLVKDTENGSLYLNFKLSFKQNTSN